MPHQSTASATPLNILIAEIAADLADLLSQAEPEPPQAGGILHVCQMAMPGLSASMATAHYVRAGLIPAAYAPATLEPAGWATVLRLLEQDAMRPLDGTPGTAKYNEGVAWAAARIRESCPAWGADNGEEPLTFRIARRSQVLRDLLNQVAMPSDELPYGGVLGMAKATITALARNTGAGLYNAFGLMAPGGNPGYLPPVNWTQLLEDLRQPEVDSEGNPLAELQYHYSEGVRWTCAKYRDLFQNLSEPGRHRPVSYGPRQ